MGLGYIALGQSSPTLSGGEAQRVKLSRELSQALHRAARSTSSTSPPPACTSRTSGSCWACWTGWWTGGNTVVVIEHNLDVIKTADHVIDIGPEGGDGGGRLVATGTPEEVAAGQGVLHRPLPGRHAAPLGAQARGPLSVRAPMRRLAVLILATAAVTEARAGDAARPVAGRSMVATRYGIVAATQPLAARAGTLMLERGGNAVDAAIAANAAMGVLEPAMNGIGGDLFVIYWDAKAGKLYGLNASGWAPAGLTRERLTAKGLTRMPHDGIDTITVPGAVAGWHALRERFGTKPFRELLAPAIRYAGEGFPVGEVTAVAWAEPLATLAASPSAARTYLIDGRPPRAGEVFKNPDLARSLARIAEAGRDGYYKGATATAIVETVRAAGGTMELPDLAELEPEWVEPVSTRYRGWTIYEIPPNTQGIAALMMLDVMGRSRSTSGASTPPTRCT